ncbi:probable glucuronoxylan glucuronosyltransferase F8H [Aristolochia californica]|uniref:probable glucuronoxylan glucuronosyltransferase F8H n=1 Tax=Aristolochia californica TaxID=171875 RepID=UPI0035D6B01D
MVIINKSRSVAGASFTRMHQIGALALIVMTFFLTRIYDQSLSSSSYLSTLSLTNSKQSEVALSSDGAASWPVRGYGADLSLKIYVYEEDEIDGVKELMRGRDRQIVADSCLKGQWGTQVKIHRLLLKSKFRTLRKEQADLFFVPSYVKCTRMMGGLNDKEINQTYVKVLNQMPYFHRSGG